jgi:hypothetical protein
MSQHSSQLLAGFGKVDVTPPLAIPYLSYYPRQTPFDGVHDRLYARALALELDGTAAAIVAVDSLGISRTILGPERDVIAEIRQRIQERTGIPAAHVLIAASHAHSTPQTTDIAPLVALFPGAAAWVDRLMDQLAAAVVVAWARRRPAAVRGTTGLAPGIAWCRRIITRDGRIVRLQQRPPDDQVVKEPRDDRVPVLLVDDAETPFGHAAHWSGALLGFTCHPTTVQVQPLVSADYPGVACDLVERELGAEACLFLQGACGNVGPVRATTDFQDVGLYGRALGGEALRALSLLGTRDVPPMRPALAAVSEVVVLERRPLPEQEPLERQAQELEAAIQAASGDEARRAAVAAYRRVAEPLQLVRLGGDPVRLEVQALRICDALVVSCEGELFVEYGNRIKDASPAGVTFVAAYANGYEGYIPTPESWDEGGYEPSLGPWTRVGPTAGEILVERMLAVAQRAWGA